MIKFTEFVGVRDSQYLGEPLSNQADLLKRIVKNSSFRSLIKKAIRSGEIDDPELSKDLKALYRSTKGLSDDDGPVNDRKPLGGDIVSRPKADGGSAPEMPEDGQ